jgi:hypothetical protein
VPPSFSAGLAAEVFLSQQVRDLGRAVMVGSVFAGSGRCRLSPFSMGVARMHAANQARQRVVRVWDDNQVDVIGHPAPAQQAGLAGARWSRRRCW